MLAGLYRKLCMEIINYWQVNKMGSALKVSWKQNLKFQWCLHFSRSWSNFIIYGRRLLVPTITVPIAGTGGSSLCVVSETHATQGVGSQRKQMPTRQQVFKSPLWVWVALPGKEFSLQLKSQLRAPHAIWQTYVSSLPQVIPVPLQQCSGSCVRLNDVMSGVLCILEGLDSDSGLVSIHPDRFCGAPQWPQPNMG